MSVHINIGIFNQLFQEGEDLFDEDEENIFHRWAVELYREKADYFGGHFEGNESRYLMTHTAHCYQLVNDKIEARIAVEKEARFNAERDGKADPLKRSLQILAVIDSFADLVGKCFGNSLVPGWEVALENFTERYLQFGISVTPKAHCIFDHLQDFCESNDRGLGLTSEQAGESLHQNFKKAWAKRKVKDTKNPRWALHLLKTILEYNALSCI
jgi:hypothetical protein